MASPRVLITGSSGRIGRAAAAEIASRGFRVRGFDRIPTRSIADAVVGSLTEREAVDRATAGCDAVIHLAATPDDDDFLTRLLPNNIVGVYHLLESARDAGVKRLILASSNQVVWRHRDRAEGLIRVDEPPAPRHWYAVTKCFLEAAGQAFAESYGLSVLAVRLGWCPRTREHAEELDSLDWAKDGYLSPGDAGRFFACAVESSEPSGYAVVYAVSRPFRRLRYDLEPTARIVGFEPRDQWPHGADFDLADASPLAAPLDAGAAANRKNEPSR